MALGRRARRYGLGRLGLALGGLVLALVAIEGALRIWPPGGATALVFGAPDGMPPDAYQGDPELFQVPVPGWSGVVRGLEYSTELRFNNLGLRGPELTEQRPRSLLVGDSFALAAQVSEADSLAGQLGTLTHTQVLNAGVDGYSTWQAFLRYRRLADAVEPSQVVLLFFLGNDLADNERFARFALSSHGQYTPQAGGGPGWWAQHTALGAWGRALTRGRALPEAEKERYARELAPFTRDPDGVLQQQLSFSTAALRSLNDETKQRGDRLLVALAPPAFVVVPDRAGPTLALAGLDPASAALDRPGQALREVLDQEGISACDLTPALKAVGPDAYLVYDGHWSAEGNAAAARAVGECLDAQEDDPLRRAGS